MSKQQVQKSSSALKFLQLVVLVVVVAGTTYYFAVGNNSNNSVTEQSVSDLAKISAGEDNGIGEAQSTASAKINRKSKIVDRESSVSQKSPSRRGNPITRARNATVSIETPWGNGSGFFIDDTYIVTNRHVVEMKQEKIEDFREKVETARQMIKLERQKIRDWKKRKSQMAKGPARSQLALIIQNSEKRLQKILPKYEAGARRLDNLDADVQPSDIKIYLSDGSEYTANYVQVSENYDLALMSLYGGEWTPIKRAPGKTRLKEGDKVYTIGSPSGLRHTVTSGVFSSYRRYKNGQSYLQTDAPINPGNSGGPLIDENGYVHGVTTMILRNTEGIGFAIPINVVYEEFGSALF